MLKFKLYDLILFINIESTLLCQLFFLNKLSNTKKLKKKLFQRGKEKNIHVNTINSCIHNKSMFAINAIVQLLK